MTGFVQPKVGNEPPSVIAPPSDLQQSYRIPCGLILIGVVDRNDFEVLKYLVTILTTNSLNEFNFINSTYECVEAYTITHAPKYAMAAHRSKGLLCYCKNLYLHTLHVQCIVQLQWSMEHCCARLNCFLLPYLKFTRQRANPTAVIV